ncbi:PAS domain S-box protein [Pontiellaceae bacterium B12227]|nr:PAS domain S-box protein [Pontiellaceae bacterium B12227]
MNSHNRRPSKPLPLKNVVLLAATLFPIIGHAQRQQAIIIPVEMSMTAYLIIGTLLILSVSMFFIFQRRFNTASKELDDVTTELGVTRHRLTETSQQLEQEKSEHQETSTRYTNILFEANVGMFQLDLAGKCTYINTALQEITGLYPKKALKEGLECAIHPEDKNAFASAWEEFVNNGENFFEHQFRFLRSKGQETLVVCKANKVLDAYKDVESYIGWVTDVTPFHNQTLLHQAETARFEHFVSEAVEGFYRLMPDSPIPLSSKPERLSEQILNTMTLSNCSDTFAALYGANPAELQGKTIGQLKDGCGPFRSAASVQTFIHEGFQSIDTESVRQDPNGNRLNMLNNVVGIIEDNKLVGIWGTQRNISKQKREINELSSRASFMHRILNSLPADIHVKDTRCRYLYASQKLADRTGIQQEEWIGKTIFEVMPATPRDHDHLAIEAMKSGKLMRCERTYEVHGKKGWLENHQAPLVSNDGLVEGIISLSLDISDRKKKEAETLGKCSELEIRLGNTQNALAESRQEQTQTAASLAEANKKVNTAEAEKIAKEHEFLNALAEQKRTEETLLRNEQGLLARKQQLEEQLSKRLADLDNETDKRRKWEELLQIKEDELLKLEENLAKLTEHYEQETVRREHSETNLAQAQTALEHAKEELSKLTENREQELEKLNAEHAAAFKTEQSDRKKAEKQLHRTKEFLESTQEQVKRMTARHATELDAEIAERKTTAEKLIRSTEELDEIRSNFNQRLEEETKAIKTELAKKQIREKALRKHEKDLEQRIKELESTLHLKAREFEEQIQAREGVEVEKNQIEQKMEQLTKQQQALLDRETQKLNLNIAGIRLDEVKLRKKAGDLEHEKEQLAEKLRVSENFLRKAQQEQQKTEAELEKTQARLKQLTSEQSSLIAEETEDLRKQLETLEKTEAKLQLSIDDINDEKTELKEALDTRSKELAKAAHEYRKMVDAYKASQQKFEDLSNGQDDLIARSTGELKAELKKLQRSEEMLHNREAEMAEWIKNHKAEIKKLNSTLKDETDHRYEAEKKLRELQVTLKANQERASARIEQQSNELKQQSNRSKENEEHLSTELKLAEATIKQREKVIAELKEKLETISAELKEFENRIAALNEEHELEVKKSIEEMKQINSLNDSLVDELNDTVQSSLDPVVNATRLLSNSENIPEDQRKQLARANYSCKNLIDSMGYRAELMQLSGKKDGLEEGELDLHKLMTDIDEQFTHRAESNNLFFAVSFAQYQASNNVPKHIIADRDKLRKTFSILLGYALEKTEKGRLGLHATRASSDTETVQVSFELAYTPTDKHDELLEGIFGGETESKIDLKHGLTLARRYIKLLGGTFELEFRDAGVTAMRIHFPFKRTGSEIIMPNNDDEKRAGAA